MKRLITVLFLVVSATLLYAEEVLNPSRFAPYYEYGTPISDIVSSSRFDNCNVKYGNNVVYMQNYLTKVYVPQTLEYVRFNALCYTYDENGLMNGYMLVAKNNNNESFNLYALVSEYTKSLSLCLYQIKSEIDNGNQVYHLFFFDDSYITYHFMVVDSEVMEECGLVLVVKLKK